MLGGLLWIFGPRAGFKARLAVTAIVVPIVLLCLGLGEFYACLRTVIGPTEVDYTKVSAEGLARYGYVRITGVELGLDKAMAVGHKDPETRRLGAWEGVYIPVGPAADVQPSGRYHVLVFMPDARQPEDVAGLADAEEVVGFVEGEFVHINPAHQTIVRTLAGADGRFCWVLRMRRPSWGKAMGFVLGSLVIPGIFVVYKIKNPGIE